MEASEIDEETVPVKVALRVRPQSDMEILQSCIECIRAYPNINQVIVNDKRPFTFDYVYDTKSKQEEIFHTSVIPLIDGCFKGNNATIFAYGQTGSGKTYTMGTSNFFDYMGDEAKGIIPRVVNEIFDRVSKLVESEVLIRLSYFMNIS